MEEKRLAVVAVLLNLNLNLNPIISNRCRLYRATCKNQENLRAAAQEKTGRAAALSTKKNRYR